MGCQLEQTLVGVNVMEEERIVNQGNVFVHQGVLFLYIAMSKQKMRATYKTSYKKEEGIRGMSWVLLVLQEQQAQQLA